MFPSLGIPTSLRLSGELRVRTFVRFDVDRLNDRCQGQELAGKLKRLFPDLNIVRVMNQTEHRRRRIHTHSCRLVLSVSKEMARLSYPERTKEREQKSKPQDKKLTISRYQLMSMWKVGFLLQRLRQLSAGLRSLK